MLSSKLVHPYKIYFIFSKISSGWEDGNADKFVDILTKTPVTPGIGSRRSRSSGGAIWGVWGKIEELRAKTKLPEVDFHEVCQGQHQSPTMKGSMNRKIIQNDDMRMFYWGQSFGKIFHGCTTA